jgi:hypothetical protein
MPKKVAPLSQIDFGILVWPRSGNFSSHSQLQKKNIAASCQEPGCAHASGFKRPDARLVGHLEDQA